MRPSYLALLALVGAICGAGYAWYDSRVAKLKAGDMVSVPASRLRGSNEFIQTALLGLSLRPDTSIDVIVIAVKNGMVSGKIAGITGLQGAAPALALLPPVTFAADAPMTVTERS